jgi:hypothetical protein
LGNQLTVSIGSSSPSISDLLQVVDQDDRRVAIGRDVTGGNLDGEALVEPVAEPRMISRASARLLAASGP